MKISIAMATYNGAQFLREQLDSFTGQTRLPDELVVSDDGSKDETINILEAFRDRAPFEVRIVHNTARAGHAQNFASALSQCVGDLICISDQDDFWKPSKLAWAADMAARHPQIDCFLNDAMLTDAELRESGITKHDQIRNQGLSKQEFVLGCCLTIRRRVLSVAIPIPRTVHAHDMWILSIFDPLGRVHRSREVLQLYRRHDANVSNIESNRLQPAGRKRAADLMRRLRALRSSDAIDYELRRKVALSERLAVIDAEAVGVDKVQVELVLSDIRKRVEILERRMAMRARSAAGRIRVLPSHFRLLRVIGLGGILKDLVAVHHVTGHGKSQCT